MAFWNKKHFEAAQPSREEVLSKELELVKEKKKALETHVGTDAWVPEDRALLTQYNEQIAKLEEELDGTNELEKAA